MPREIPLRHFPGSRCSAIPRYDNYVPNIVITYDPTYWPEGQREAASTTTFAYLRTDSAGRPLPPLPQTPCELPDSLLLR